MPAMKLSTINYLLELFEKGLITVSYRGDPGNIWGTGYPIVELWHDNKKDFLVQYFEDAGDWDYIQQIDDLATGECARFEDIPTIVSDALDSYIQAQLFPKSEAEKAVLKEQVLDAMKHSLANDIRNTFFDDKPPLFTYLKAKGLIKKFDTIK